MATECIIHKWSLVLAIVERKYYYFIACHLEDSLKTVCSFPLVAHSISSFPLFSYGLLSKPLLIGCWPCDQEKRWQGSKGIPSAEMSSEVEKVIS